MKNLSQFDLVIPLEVFWKHPQPLKDVLGWTDLKEVHVVPSGEVKDNNVLSNLTIDEFQILWDPNRLVIILHAWSKVVYMARMLCGGDGWGLD